MTESRKFTYQMFQTPQASSIYVPLNILSKISLVGIVTPEILILSLKRCGNYLKKK